MNKAYSEIAFILDRSGSMEPVKHAAIEGFNTFLREQQQTEGHAKITLVLFDDRYEVPIRSIPVQEATTLNEFTYVPRGTTALLDAIGRTIDDLGKRVAALPERNRPGQVIVAILTDGLENASRYHTWKNVSRRIRRQTEKYNWLFLFLGANQDAIATAAQMSIPSKNAANYFGDFIGTKSSSASISKKASAARRILGKISTRDDRRVNLQSLSELVEEQDRKERRGD